MKYRKKPVVIEAFRFGLDKFPEWFKQDWIFEDEIIIETLEGNMKAVVGDYIIKGIAGEIYPCKSEIFLASYEAVDD